MHIPLLYSLAYKLLQRPFLTPMVKSVDGISVSCETWNTKDMRIVSELELSLEDQIHLGPFWWLPVYFNTELNAPVWHVNPLLGNEMLNELPRRQTLDKQSVAKLRNSGTRLCNPLLKPAR
jgi:hypothetical protein